MPSPVPAIKIEAPPLAPVAAESTHHRSRLFRETPVEVFKRWVLGTAWALKPPRIGGLPTLARMWLGNLFRRLKDLPDPFVAADNPPGLCGFVNDLSPLTLVAAYRQGLHPFAHVGPLKWWSLPERCILSPVESFHIAKRLRRQMRQARYAVTFDRDFAGVMSACAGAREGRWHLTWITPRIMHAYAELFDAGHAHSFEVWNERGELVGGGYGVAVGGAFYTESQFSRESNTSKIGFSVLNWHLARWGYVLNDGKGPTPTILDMGFRMISREEFHVLLACARALEGKSGRWELETDLETVAAWQPQNRAAVPVDLEIAAQVSGRPGR
jgi:leucyl/phenylalanyl-tRNA--protein transferase